MIVTLSPSTSPTSFRPWRNEARRLVMPSDDLLSRNPITGRDGNFTVPVPNSLLEIGGFARDTYWDGHACLGLTHLFQPSAEHFEQCAEFVPLRNRRLRALSTEGG